MLFPTYPVSPPRPIPTLSHALRARVCARAHMHIQTFHFLCVRSPGQAEWRASVQHAQAGKQEGEFKGVQHEIVTELGETQSSWQNSSLDSK